MKKQTTTNKPLVEFKRVCDDNRDGIYLLRDGEIICDIPFVGTEEFNNGVARVQLRSGDYNYINEEGKFVSPINFSTLGDFDDNDSADAEVDGMKGTLNKNGKFSMKNEK